MTEEQKQVVFKEDVKVLDHENEVVFEAKAGQKEKLPIASADRWIRRDKATDDLKWKPEVVKADDETETEV